MTTYILKLESQPLTIWNDGNMTVQPLMIYTRYTWLMDVVHTLPVYPDVIRLFSRYIRSRVDL